jgi:hypothetical protein
MKKVLAGMLLGGALAALVVWLAPGSPPGEPPSAKDAPPARRDAALEARLAKLERGLALSQELLARDERQIVNFQVFIARLGAEGAAPSSATTQPAPRSEAASAEAARPNAREVPILRGTDDRAVIVATFGPTTDREELDETTKGTAIDFSDVGVRLMLDGAGNFAWATFADPGIDGFPKWRYRGVELGARGVTVLDLLGAPDWTKSDGQETTLGYTALDLQVKLGPPPLFFVREIRLEAVR